MQPSEREEVADWLAKANEDLAVAEMIARSGSYFGSAVYHCQQCAEKALKAFIVAHGMAPHRTHDLVGLLRDCAALAREFGALEHAATELNPFSRRFRYPGAREGPAAIAVEEALDYARAILAFVTERLASYLGR